METKEYRICSRCVMDSSDVDIVFDNNGHCNHCNNYFERIATRVYAGEESDKELEQFVLKIKKSGKNKKYDCIIGVSGGIDSSYVAYVAKKQGLKPLLVHLDNGWNSEISEQNIKNLAEILELDYESFVLDWEEFKDLQLSFLKASVPEMETPTDIAIPGALHKIAAKYGIKYIISGGNFATEGILPKTWHYNAKDMKYFKYIHRKFGTKKLKQFPIFGAKEEIYYKLIKGIKMFYILNYVPYNKEEAMSVLQNELAWKYYGGKHYESKITGFWQSYAMPVKYNMDYRRATLASQIVSRQVTRDYAIEKLKELPYDPDKIESDKTYIAKKYAISREEFDSFLNQEPKTYKDFPNQKKLILKFYDWYRRIFRKEKLASF